MVECKPDIVPTKTDNNTFELFIPPWALSKEEIPIYLEWSSNVTIDQIRIIVPNEFEVMDVLNVSEFEITTNDGAQLVIVSSALSRNLVMEKVKYLDCT